MKSVTLKIWVVFLFFQPLGVVLEVLLGGVPRRRDPKLSGFCALECDNTYFAFFLSHGVPPKELVIRDQALCAKKKFT